MSVNMSVNRIGRLVREGLVMTERDFERLTRLVESLDEQEVLGLETELGRARVVPDGKLPPDVVTMNSRLVYQNVETGEQREVVLVYPDDADGARGYVSVLAPVGTALLGLRVGQTITWPSPRGMMTLRVLETGPRRGLPAC